MSAQNSGKNIFLFYDTILHKQFYTMNKYIFRLYMSEILYVLEVKEESSDFIYMYCKNSNSYFTFCHTFLWHGAI